MTELLLLVYASAELILAAQISISNFLVIFVYLRSKHIRTPTNAYIFSLALTDFLTGAMGIPFTVVSVLTRWPGSFYACLAIHLILCALCTVSTLHLLAMAVDKYLTICLRRFVQQRNSSSSSVRKTRAHFLIIGCWLIGTAIASLPMVDGFGFASQTVGKFRGECHFTVVVDYRYLVFIIFFGTIILPSIVIAYCYVSIYKRIRNEERQIKCLLRASERQRRISVRRKLIRILLILVLTYAFCWYPLYLINTVDLFFPQKYHPGQKMTLFAVVLSHLNCALNPLIYAYGMPGFKHSLRRFLPTKLKTTSTKQQQQSTNINQTNLPPMNLPFGGYGIPMGRKRIILNNNLDIKNNKHDEKQREKGEIDVEGKIKFLENQDKEPLQPSMHLKQHPPQSLLEMKRENFRLKSKVVFSDEQTSPLKHSSTFETEDHLSFNNSLENEQEEIINNKKVSFANCKLERVDKFALDLEKVDDKIANLKKHKQSWTSDSNPCFEEEISFEFTEQNNNKKTEEQQETTKLDRMGKTSIASKISTFSLRIFNGHWLVRNTRKECSVREQINNNKISKEQEVMVIEPFDVGYKEIN